MYSVPNKTFVAFYTGAFGASHICTYSSRGNKGCLIQQATVIDFLRLRPAKSVGTHLPKSSNVYI